MTPEQERLLNELVAFKRSLEMSATIPRGIDQAFRERFNLRSNVVLDGSPGTYNPANITTEINISGDPETIEVLEFPAGYIPLTINGTTYKVAYFQD